MNKSSTTMVAGKTVGKNVLDLLIAKQRTEPLPQCSRHQAFSPINGVKIPTTAHVTDLVDLIEVLHDMTDDAVVAQNGAVSDGKRAHNIVTLKPPLPNSGCIVVSEYILMTAHLRIGAFPKNLGQIGCDRIAHYHRRDGCFRKT
jgi:hypothetical protein